MVRRMSGLKMFFSPWSSGGRYSSGTLLWAVRSRWLVLPASRMISEFLMFGCSEWVREEAISLVAWLCLSM